MQSLLYSEMLEDSQIEARGRESMALQKSIDLMERAGQQGADIADRLGAITFTVKLWAVLIEDLASPANSLPKELRAQIVSIGIWIMRDLERIRSESGHDFSDVIQVSKAIQDGLL